MRILIDLDDTIADFQGRLAQLYNENNPNKPFDVAKRKDFYLGRGDTEHLVDDTWHLMRGIGFFLSLDPIKGAVEAVNHLQNKHEVYIVTSAGTTFPLAPTEKYQWVEREFGIKMLNNLVITRAKYLVDGDILIDDKPFHEDEDKASWQHVVFDQPYNRHLKNTRLNWSNYPDVINSLKK